ncbi:SDR family NAD(P)-dependent oxidoreductase [Paucilactobacillus suebicus]|uniref:Short-chain dehydrogenase n=1 Tax=Paucilactobacillus suebicus DSM 5007 = KCTC 3549 TaxID=1423807 RepID=A0A0R1W0N9_9LACO|nr:SDR family NAD(P)-dependent oxidoreductase [Paucilactobacillus suebicus]KRM11181.1 short-chain dehydrogenase [Paucilactobacillus suebicus DSM 5007 = KCTC 3549]
MINQNDNYVVITGASSGIGAAAVRKFASLGRNVIMIARRVNLLNQLHDKIIAKYPDRDIVVIQQDLSKINDIPSLYEQINKQYNIDIWVNNAGFGKIKFVDELSTEEVISMVQTNSEALALLSVLFVKDHENDEAQLINVSSRAGYQIWPKTTIYSATKFFVSALTEGLDRELISKGAKMRAKILAPNATNTEFERVAKNLNYDVNYDEIFANYNSSKDLADFLIELINSNASIGFVNDNFQLELGNGRLL